MNPFARWSINTQALAVVLGFLVLWLSLRPNAGRLLIMASCYAVISLAFGWAGIFHQFFGIRMATAFGGTPLPVFAYLTPLLETAFFVVPIYGLFTSAPVSRRIGFISFAIILPIMFLVEIVGPYLGPQSGGRPGPLSHEKGVFVIPHGLTALMLAALWLRIYSCRFDASPAKTAR
jgi:hypothetical protein